MKRCGPEPFIDLTQETTLHPVETQKQEEEEVSHEDVKEDDGAGEHETEEQQEDIEREEVGDQNEIEETEERGGEEETVPDEIAKEILDSEGEEVAHDISTVQEAAQDLPIEMAEIDATDSVNEDTTANLVMKTLDAPSPLASPAVDADTTLVDLDGVNEPSQDAFPPSPSTPSKKRKAEEISTDEVDDVVSLPPLPIGEPSPVAHEPIIVIPLDAEQEEQPRPVKRFHGTAGKVGYAALGGLVGGIAIFTTLVASGPTF